MPDVDQPPPILCPPLSLKRKRPPGIVIPNVLREIPADAAEKNKQDAVVSLSGAGVGVLSVKGKKKFMEDTFKIVSCSNLIKGFFGVYDGHGGRKAANFVAENLHTNILEMLENYARDKTKEEAVEAGYLKTDEDFLKRGVTSGACCVTAFIEGDKVVVSNLGDCRAVLCRGGMAEALTTDHRAGNDDEKKRIENKGGYVEMHRGAWRVHGVLSVSRSIGDAHLKEWVVAEPDTKTLHLSPDMEYLVLASDGLWEKIGNQEATDIVIRSSRDRKKPGPIKEDRDENEGEVILVPNSNPVTKLQRSPLIEQKKKMNLSPIKPKIFRKKENEDEFPSENDGPPLKDRRVSVQYQDEENNKIVRREVESENEGPPLKFRRVLVQYQDEENNKIVRKEDEFPSENEGPPLEAQRVLSQYQDQENSNRSSNSCELKSACNELVKLALSRGSLDDITVMIIDLNHFK